MGLFTKSLATGMLVASAALVRGGVNDISAGNAVVGGIKIAAGAVTCGIVTGITTCINYTCGAAKGAAADLGDTVADAVRDGVDRYTT